MAINLPFSLFEGKLKLQTNIKNELVVKKIDPYYEKMKKIGKIMPGYTEDPNDRITCYDIVDGILRIPFYYGFNKFKIKLDQSRYIQLEENIKCTVDLRDNQIPVIEHCMKDLQKYNTTTVGMPPGFGKTFIGMYLGYQLQEKIIIIVPRISLLKQWLKTSYESLKDAYIWPAFLTTDEIKDFDKSFDFFDKKTYEKLPKEIPDVTICLDPRIKKIPDDWKNRIGTLILDEAHMLPTKGRIDNLLSLRPLYIIMETATMEREDGLHKICHFIAGKHGYYKTACDHYDFKIIDLPQIEVEEVIGARGMDYNFLCNSLSEDEEYNEVILKIVKDNPENKFIVLTKRIPHGNYLVKMFKENGITADSLMGTKKSYVNSRVLVGTYNKIGTGFDEKSASSNFEGNTSDSMIMCHSVANTQNFEQYRGRVMRNDNPTIYWLNVYNKVVRSQLGRIKKHVIKTNGVITTDRRYAKKKQ